ncbi:hypothetical protein LWI29_023227 [Acer saccharum]|uniref:Amino acid transporter transmembrane domain-containing protein n=1 Tax=Acer saccharum TaxID=4024 RepID=A0AA39W2L4_ACESA|nr:hypothetical protein LWI29_023227 [Acer saccharum]
MVTEKTLPRTSQYSAYKYQRLILVDSNQNSCSEDIKDEKFTVPLTFKFVPFANLDTHKDGATQVDIIAIAIDMQPAHQIRTKQGPSTIQELIVINKELKPMVLTMWNQFVDNEAAHIFQLIKTRPIIIAAHLKVVSYNGEWWHAGFHLTTAIVGPTILMLPYVFRGLGWGLGCMCLTVMGLVTFYSYYLMSRELDHCEKAGRRHIRFPELAADVLDNVFGPFTQRIFETVRVHSNGDSVNDSSLPASKLPLPQTHQLCFSSS